jgi:hypothetical protein
MTVEGVPAYVVARIRQDPPPNCHVIEGSTPVVAFGDLLRARVATLGLNPSRGEFEVENRTTHEWTELLGAKRRFETTRSLEIPTLTDAPDAAVAAIVKRCNEYFKGNPYRRWFNRLEPVLRATGSSYYDGSACHLDLSQWATNPTWNELSPTVRAVLVRGDVSFLSRQLQAENIELLLLNGAAVVDAFRDYLGGELAREPDTIQDRRVTTRLWTGRYNGTRVVGWSTNLPSSYGVTRTLVAELSARIVLLAGHA